MNGITPSKLFREGSLRPHMLEARYLAFQAEPSDCGTHAMKIRRKKHQRRLDPAILANIVARIVKVAEPEKVILFGSAARGQMGPHSDLDFLIIKSGRFNRGRLSEEIYMCMEGAGEAVDLIIVTPEEVQKYSDTPWLVIAPALKEGKVVYAA